jgi:hypothetical protein
MAAKCIRIEGDKAVGPVWAGQPHATCSAVSDPTEANAKSKKGRGTRQAENLFRVNEQKRGRLCQKRIEGPISCRAYQEIGREKIVRRKKNKTDWKDDDMKTMNEITRMFRGSRLALAAILIASVGAAASANAQYKFTGDGIAASPKLRQQINERIARSTPAVAPVPTMACAKCKDTWMAQKDNSKGLGARTLMGQTTKLVPTHLCAGCGTDWSVAGTGKGSHAVATHKCSSCGSENFACCSGKSTGNLATKGMGTSVEVAPLK